MFRGWMGEGGRELGGGGGGEGDEGWYFMGYRGFLEGGIYRRLMVPARKMVQLHLHRIWWRCLGTEVQPVGLGEFDFGALHYRVDACGILGYHRS